ncbi:ABC transporter ATP-binding protein [Chelativorans sp. AA-79]|uniref:ABC transporter ATP-binding protein n=1 Tax=Chelativorans sp. AA-79 TaxID=3028735 RepID=UPI0023F7F9DA|nr:ABC transporter ATP-binding protein [Chelativorans sp. AA-79]WEX08017.1 ABC transporter ATP-binding protein [Chelativorans sp. AA-79]
MSLLACNDLTVSYSPAARPVLNGVSVKFSARRFTALVGPNGCGKSTLIKTIMGFLPTSSGTVSLDGKPVLGTGRKELAKRVAYLPQENYCPDYITLGELVELGAYARYSLFGGPDEKDRALFADALATVGLEDMASKPVNALSGGQRQRAWIAMILAQDSDVILLDEPVNHLDVRYQYSILTLIRSLTQRGKTIVAVLHDLNLTAAFSDEVVMMCEGRIIAHGTTSESITSSNVRRVFDFDADIFRRGERLVCLPQSVDTAVS